MKSRRIHYAILGADLLWMALVLFGSFYLHYRDNWRLGFSQPAMESFLLILPVCFTGWLLLFEVMDLDCFHGGWQMPAMISKTSTAAALLMAVIAIAAYLTPLHDSRLPLLDLALLVWLGVALIRWSAYGILRAQQRAGKTRKLVLIGDGHLSREVADRIRRHPELLYEVMGFLTPFGSSELASGGEPGASSNGIGSLDALEFLKKHGVQELVVLEKHAPGIELQKLLDRCQEERIHVHLLPQPYELYISRPRLFEIDGVPLLSLEQPSFSRAAQMAKRFMDVSLGSLLLIPAMAILAIPGGALWVRERRFIRREIRCGRQGRPFGMFRLDIVTEEEKSSRFHKLLRRSSISELPQLLNVVLGQMSLVGPRPEPPERVRDYSEWQKQRLKVTPGMTGLAQVNGLREQHSSEEKTRHDLQYALHWTPILDLVLLVQTVSTLAGRLLHYREHVADSAAGEPLPIAQEASRPMAHSLGE